MTLIEMSLAGGCVILVTALLRAAAKARLPVGMFEALWALAVLRLTVPAALPFRWSVWTLLGRTASAGNAPAAMSRAAPAAIPPQVYIMHSPGGATEMGPGLWTLVYALGVCVLALLLTARYIRAGRRFRGAEAIEDGYANQFLGAHPLRRRVSVRVSDRVGTPLTYGVLRPVILLPRSMDLRDRETLGYVLAHELAHIRRLDGVRKLALAAVVCVHWSNPAVWLMLVLATRDMELACDQAVIRAFGPDARRGYAHALLDMEERRSGLTGLASGFAKNAIEERIHSIMKTRPRSFLSMALALVLVLATGAVFATAAPEDQTVIGDADGPTYITVTEDAPVMFSGDVISSSDGTVYLFTDEGKPVSMTRQEYGQLIDPVAVEWWTAEDYADWLEQEKKDLQDCLGQRAWTSADGWFTWTQEKIDETIEMYEQVLEDIENGLLVSKTVDGSSDADLTEGTDTAVQFSRGIATDEGWTVHMMTEAEAAAMNDHLSALMLGDGSAPEYTLAGWTDFRGRLGPYEKVYFDLGRVTADETVTAAVQADRDGGCHVSICPKGEGPGDYLTTVRQEEAASAASAEPNAYYCYSDAGLRPGDYTVCVWSSVDEPIEFALSYTVS